MDHHFTRNSSRQNKSHKLLFMNSLEQRTGISMVDALDKIHFIIFKILENGSIEA